MQYSKNWKHFCVQYYGITCVGAELSTSNNAAIPNLDNLDLGINPGSDNKLT